MENTNDEFKREHLSTLWDQISFWFFKRKVYKVKVQSLWEANMDKMFFETVCKDDLNYKDDEDRKLLMEENRKPLDKQDRLRIMALEERIGRAKAVKSGYDKTEQFRADTKSYIKMLQEWK